jgi:hypothetical protein
MAWRPTRAVRKTPGPGYSKTCRGRLFRSPGLARSRLQGAAKTRLFPHVAEFFSREASGVPGTSPGLVTPPATGADSKSRLLPPTSGKS